MNSIWCIEAGLGALITMHMFHYRDHGTLADSPWMESRTKDIDVQPLQNIQLLLSKTKNLQLPPTPQFHTKSPKAGACVTLSVNSGNYSQAFYTRFFSP